MENNTFGVPKEICDKALEVLSYMKGHNITRLYDIDLSKASIEEPKFNQPPITNPIKSRDEKTYLELKLDAETQKVIKLNSQNLTYKLALQKIARATICHDLNLGTYCTINATVVVAKKALEEIEKEDL